MFYIEDADAVQVMPTRAPASTLVRHFFQAGNTRTGTPATVVTDDFLNIVMNELCNVVEAADLTLDKMDDTQLLQAIRQIAGSGKSLGIPLWSAADCYSPLPHIVWGGDLMLYIAELPSGPCVAAGPQNPTTTTGYWISLPDWLKKYLDFSGGGSDLPKPYGNNGTVLTVADKDTERLEWADVKAQSKYGFYAVGSASQSLTQNALQTLRFNSIQYNEFPSEIGYYDASAYRFVARRKIRLFVGASANANSSSIIPSFHVGIRKNGSGIASNQNASPNVTSTTSAFAIADMDAGDYLEAYCSTESSSAVVFSQNQTLSWFKGSVV